MQSVPCSEPPLGTKDRTVIPQGPHMLVSTYWEGIMQQSPKYVLFSTRYPFNRLPGPILPVVTLFEKVLLWQALAVALCKNTTLTCLDLGHNYLESKGEKALAGALCKNTLTFLDLNVNNLGSEGGKH
ncbi:hypothetical protein C2G38_2164746 [Gigaspora rosea]|uniref:Uncharacterized protein n=1 Tax=Gigaspora rosea TaxID=44941 RepID=A0A397VVW4_9GLOM|nr:hypothetical protein C2G38_2164746 [Gigaspora rosea]